MGIGVIWLFSSCKTPKPSYIYVNRDSIITKTETVFKDTIITIPGDTIRFQIPCNKDTVFIYKSKSSTSMVTVNKGIVTVQNNCDEKDLIISKLREQISHYEIATSDSVKTEIVTVKHVPTIYKVFTWGFWVLLLGLATILYLNQNLWVLLISATVSIFKVFKKKK